MIAITRGRDARTVLCGWKTAPFGWKRMRSADSGASTVLSQCSATSREFSIQFDSVVHLTGGQQQSSRLPPAIIVAASRPVFTWADVPIVCVRRCSPVCRGVAQPGRAPGSGPGGRRFKSSLPDQFSVLACSKIRSKGFLYLGQRFTPSVEQFKSTDFSN